MSFIEYKNDLFNGLNNIQTEILSSSTNGVDLFVDSIIICNTEKRPLRFTLKKLRTATTNVEINLINELKILPYSTINILQDLGPSLLLQYSSSPSLIDSLVCYSKGENQKFDCNISYSFLTNS